MPTAPLLGPRAHGAAASATAGSAGARPPRTPSLVSYLPYVIGAACALLILGTLLHSGGDSSNSDAHSNATAAAALPLALQLQTTESAAATTQQLSEHKHSSKHERSHHDRHSKDAAKDAEKKVEAAQPQQPQPQPQPQSDPAPRPRPLRDEDWAAGVDDGDDSSSVAATRVPDTRRDEDIFEEEHQQAVLRIYGRKDPLQQDQQEAQTDGESTS